MSYDKAFSVFLCAVSTFLVFVSGVSVLFIPSVFQLLWSSHTCSTGVSDVNEEDVMIQMNHISGAFFSSSKASEWNWVIA
jgi:hypothetical protein